MVRRDVQRADQPVDRGEIDDASASRAAHPGDRVLGAEEDALDVDCLDPIPFPFGQLVRRLARAGDAGVVDENVDLLEGIDDLSKDALDIRLSGDVGMPVPCRAARAADLAREIRPLLVERIQDRHSGPFSRQKTARGAADSERASRHDGRLSLHPSHQLSFQRASSILRATFRRSCTKVFFARRLAVSSGARRIEEGWTVAVTKGARSDFTKVPRLFITRKDGPRRAWAAVAPRQTRTLGWIKASSASSQGRQAPISAELGFWWTRLLPRGSHLKCLTTLVT